MQGSNDGLLNEDLSGIQDNSVLEDAPKARRKSILDQFHEGLAHQAGQVHQTESPTDERLAGLSSVIGELKGSEPSSLLQSPRSKLGPSSPPSLSPTQRLCDSSGFDELQPHPSPGSSRRLAGRPPVDPETKPRASQEIGKKANVDLEATCGEISKALMSLAGTIRKTEDVAGGTALTSRSVRSESPRTEIADGSRTFDQLMSSLSSSVTNSRFYRKSGFEQAQRGVWSTFVSSCREDGTNQHDSKAARERENLDVGVEGRNNGVPGAESRLASAPRFGSPGSHADSSTEPFSAPSSQPGTPLQTVRDLDLKNAKVSCGSTATAESCASGITTPRDMETAATMASDVANNLATSIRTSKITVAPTVTNASLLLPESDSSDTRELVMSASTGQQARSYNLPLWMSCSRYEVLRNEINEARQQYIELAEEVVRRERAERRRLAIEALCEEVAEMRREWESSVELTPSPKPRRSVRIRPVPGDPEDSTRFGSSKLGYDVAAMVAGGPTLKQMPRPNLRKKAVMM